MNLPLNKAKFRQFSQGLDPALTFLLFKQAKNCCKKSLTIQSDYFACIKAKNSEKLVRG